MKKITLLIDQNKKSVQVAICIHLLGQQSYQLAIVTHVLQGADFELPERHVSEMHRHDVETTWDQINTLHYLNKLTQAGWQKHIVLFLEPIEGIQM